MLGNCLPEIMVKGLEMGWRMAGLLDGHPDMNGGSFVGLGTKGELAFPGLNALIHREQAQVTLESHQGFRRVSHTLSCILNRDADGLLPPAQVNKDLLRLGVGDGII